MRCSNTVTSRDVAAPLHRPTSGPCGRTGFARNRLGRESSRAECADREHVDAVGPPVAESCAGDDAEHGRGSDSGRVDLLQEVQQGGYAFVDPARAELDLERSPSTVHELHDGT